MNFSLVDDNRPNAVPGTEFPRLVVLSHDGVWDGGVEGFEANESKVRGGEIDLVFGPNYVRYVDGEYRVSAKMRTRPISMDLILTPTVMPALSNNIRMDAGTPINWLVLPRLTVRGSVEIAGRKHIFENAAGYHDHNWGQFGWGRDFTWEWCYALPNSADSPRSLVFVRLLNRARTKVYKQGLFLWRGVDPERIFRGRDIETSHTGLLRAQPIFKIPRPMALLTPGTANDVPREITVQARGENDEVQFQFIASDVAQVIIPSDVDQNRVTIINEITGKLSLTGTVRGEKVSLTGPGIFELVRA